MVVLLMITYIAFHPQLSGVNPTHALYFFTHPALRYTPYTTFWASWMVQAIWHEASDFLGKFQVYQIWKANTDASVHNRYLVRERIPIDLAVLCNIMERLFGLAIMTDKSRGNLHGVVLPRSWVLALWKDFVTFKERTLAPLWVLAYWTETLLKGVYTGAYLRETMKDFNFLSESE
jgi:hypothetical protein